MRYFQVRLAMLLLAVFTLVGNVTLQPHSAAAQPGGGGISQPIPCTIGGVASTCTLTVTSFQVIGGVLNAVGTVTGGDVSVPFQVPVISADGTCDILNLILGPLHLNLLGLVVDLNQVVLNITAQSGGGQLLGNLLCAVAHLLDSNSPLTALVDLLNQILGAL
jgi:hypothetical protein